MNPPVEWITCPVIQGAAVIPSKVPAEPLTTQLTGVSDVVRERLREGDHDRRVIT